MQVNDGAGDRGRAAEAVFRAGRRRAAAREAERLATADLAAAVRAARVLDIPVREVQRLGGRLSSPTVTSWTRAKPGAAGEADRLDVEALLEAGHSLRVVHDPGEPGGYADPDDPSVYPGMCVMVLDADGLVVAEGTADTLLGALTALEALDPPRAPGAAPAVTAPESLEGPPF